MVAARVRFCGVGAKAMRRLVPCFACIRAQVSLPGGPALGRTCFVCMPQAELYNRAMKPIPTCGGLSATR